MPTETTRPEKILRFAIGCVVVSSVAAVLFVLLRHVGWVRGPVAGVGIMAAFIGSGVAGWFAFRARDCRLTAAAFASALPLAFWIWALYDIVHVDAA